VEDYAAGQLRMRSGVSVRIACSWNLHAGRDAVIGASFHGTRAGAIVRNVHGSFYDFEAVLARGTTGEVIASPPDDWGGRAAVSWARRLGEGSGFDESIASLVKVAETLDWMYGRRIPDDAPVVTIPLRPVGVRSA
jgi:predicted dehydrogenase